jgi:two-component system sensor kinase FixL
LTADTAARLFQPLFSTKAQGLGMGLTIVRSIVERHGGRIRAENHAMGGALFRVTLPRALGAEPRVQPSRPRLSLTDVELPLSGIAGTA